MEENYIAFISYRHKPLDMKIASQLHRLIERYRIPSDLRKGNGARLGRVFRDRDELPLSSDLSADIKSALDRSRFLIVVCTPDTPQSPWIEREIAYFLEHHDLSHILAVLADGSPEESFPRQITHIYEEDKVTLNRIVEPLAANVVTPAKIKRHFLLRAEFLRLAAAILECPYDALKQREKRYRQQRISMAAITAAVIAVGFIGMLARKNYEIQAQSDEIRLQKDKIQEQNDEIAIQFEQAQKNESYALSLLSAQFLEEGDRDGAVENAVNALPSVSKERPLSIEAELALCNALYAYQDTGLKAGCRLEQDTDIRDMILSRDGNYVVTTDEYLCLRVYSGYTGRLLWERSDLQAYKEHLTIIESEQALLYFWSGENILFSLQDGTVIKEASIEEGREIFVSDTEKIAVCPVEGYDKELQKDTYSFNFYRMPEFEMISQSSVIDVVKHGEVVNGCFSQDETRYAVEIEGEEDEKTQHRIYVLDVGTGDCLYHTVYEEQEEYFSMDMVFLPDGDFIVFRCEWSYEPFVKKQYLERFNADTGEVVYSREFSEEYTSLNIKMLLSEDRGLFKLFCFDIGGKDFISFNLWGGDIDKCAEFSSECRDCYWLDESYMDYAVVTGDGNIETRNQYSSDFSEPEEILFNTGYSVSQAYAGGLGKDYLCIVSEEQKNYAIIYRYCGDEQKESILMPSLAGDFRKGHYVFPSGDRVAYIGVDGVDSDSSMYRYRMLIYDTSLEKEIDQYEFVSEDIGLRFQGFSKDETKLIFSDCVYDMETETCMPLPKRDQVHFRDLFYAFKKPYEQTEGMSTTLVYYRYEQLYWWEDGEYRQNSCPYDGWTYHGTLDYEKISVAVGGSGLVVIPINESYVSYERPDAYVIYSKAEDKWIRLQNLCQEEGFPAYCVGNEKPWVAFCDYDGILRIVDGKTGKLIREFPLGIEADALEEAQFLLGDTILLLRQSDCLTLIDTTDGARKADVDLIGFSEKSELTVQTDKEGGNLYIGERNGGIDGVCIDLDTWEIRAVIPGLIFFMPAARKVVKWDALEEKYVSYPAYTVQELVEKGETFLAQ